MRKIAAGEPEGYFNGVIDSPGKERLFSLYRRKENKHPYFEWVKWRIGSLLENAT